MKKIFLFLVLSFTFLFAQLQQSPVYFENFISEEGGEYFITIFYRVNYSALIFEKENNIQTSTFSISFKIQNTDNNKIINKYVSHTVKDSSKSFSEKNFSSQIKFKLTKANYRIIPRFEVKNTSIISNLPKLVLTKNDFDHFSILYFDENYNLLISNKNIPFTHKKINLILLSDYKTDFEINIIQSGKVVFKKELKRLKLKNSIFNKLRLKNKSLNIYIVNNINLKLLEGEYKLIILQKGLIIKRIEGKVFWENKPLTLFDDKFRIKALRIIGEYDNYKDFDSDYPDYKKLFYFWKKYDPTPETEFNELMNEFYVRVDEAIIRFATIDQKNGALTDMGKVFIKYGEPDNVSRTYSKRNETVEIWEYANNKKFVFEDLSGSGKFELLK